MSKMTSKPTDRSDVVRSQSATGKKTVFLFRHGETDWNKTQRMQGQSDVPLNEEGHKQAELLVYPAKLMKIEKFLSSDLSRAYETALKPARAMGLDVETSPMLREADMGLAEGLGFNEVLIRFGEASIQRWRSVKHEDLSFGFPDGETGQEVLDRVFGYLATRLETIAEERIGVVSHGAVLRRMIQSLDPTFPFSQFIPNAVMFTFELGTDRQWKFLDFTPLSDVK